MSELSPELRQRLIDRARPHYDSEMPYHNWRHAVDVMHTTEKITGFSTHPEIRENKDLLKVAAAWHDADYHIAADEDRTKEERSAALVHFHLFELTERQRMIIANGIIDTTVEKSRKDSLFGAVLHIADVGYLAADHHSFLNRLNLLHAEWGHPRWNETVERTKAFGGQVILEARKTLTEAVSERAAEGWVTMIERNLHKLDETVK